MLANAVGLKEVTFSENVKNMYPNNLEGLFWNCENLGSSIDGKSYNENPIVNIDKFNTEDVTNMDYLFYGDSHLVTLDLSSFVTNKISNTPVFIKELKQKAQGNLLANSIYTGKHYAKEMFTECYRLNKLYLNSVYDPSYESCIEG